MTIQRTSGGIKYDTAVKEVSQKSTPMPTPTKSTGSGDAKIAASKAASSGSSRVETPQEYAAKAEAAKQSIQAGSNVITTTRPVTAEEIAAAKQNVVGMQLSPVMQTLSQQNQQSVFQNTAPVYYKNPITNTYEKTFQTVVRETSQKIVEPSIIKMQEAEKEIKDKMPDGVVKTNLGDYPAIGKYVPEQYKDIQPSVAIYQQSKKLASAIREEGEKTKTPGLKYPIESVARIVEFGGMLPGGAETIIKNKDIAKDALIFGAVSVPSGLATQLREEPKQLVSDLVVTSAIGYGIGKGVKGVKSEIRFSRMEKVPVESLARPEVVSGKAVFPTAKQGTPIPDVIGTFKETSARYPGVTVSGRDYGIHVSNIELPTKRISKTIETIEGSSETPGLYVGPDASLYFGKTGSGPSKITLFGVDGPAQQPSINFVGLRSIERLPPELRANTELANAFMRSSAKKETGYTTVKMESGLKVGARERELVVPAESTFRQVESKFYTEYGGQRIPVKRFEPIGDIATSKKPSVLESITGRKTRKGSDLFSSSSSGRVKEYPIITPSRMAKSYRSSLLRPSSSSRGLSSSSAGSRNIISSSRTTFSGSSSSRSSIIDRSSSRSSSTINEDYSIISSISDSERSAGTSSSSISASSFSSGGGSGVASDMFRKVPETAPFKPKSSSNLFNKKGASLGFKQKITRNPFKEI